jgi:hypothetical protein
MLLCVCRRQYWKSRAAFLKPRRGTQPIINVAVAEKLSALRSEEYLRERIERADVVKAKRLLKRAGRGNRPQPGDEVD